MVQHAVHCMVPGVVHYTPRLDDMVSRYERCGRHGVCRTC